MDTVLKNITDKPWFERVYQIGVGVKGVDGLLELTAGIWLIVAPRTLHTILHTASGHASRHPGHTFHFIAEYVARLDTDLARSGVVFLVVFLIGHGIVKLALVYCLLRRIIWAYPYALGILGLFLVYQIYVLIQHPTSIGMWLFSLLDLIIIALVWDEYKKLRTKQSHPKAGA